jgi:hypothetical protein
MTSDRHAASSRWWMSLTTPFSQSLTRTVSEPCHPDAVPTRSCALGFVAKTGTGVAVAVASGPELLGKWELMLAPPTQERFVYHAAQQLGARAERWVRESTQAIGHQTMSSVDVMLTELDATPTAAAIVGTTLELDGLDEILASHPRLHTAEGVLYRSAIADALHERGIECTLVPRDALVPDTALAAFGKVASPWRREHKDAARAALSLVRANGRGSAPRTASAARPRRRA